MADESKNGERLVPISDGLAFRDGSRMDSVTHVREVALTAAGYTRGSALGDDELVRVLTDAMRRADRDFERVGGSTRHHVRDCLIPALEAAGLKVVSVTQEKAGQSG